MSIVVILLFVIGLAILWCLVAIYKKCRNIVYSLYDMYHLQEKMYKDMSVIIFNLRTIFALLQFDNKRDWHNHDTIP